jgi:hypothetical protein
MRLFQAIAVAVCVTSLVAGCAEKPKPWGREEVLWLRTPGTQVWAVAPAVNLSGQPGVDPLLQADLLFAQVQTIKGVSAIPVNRVVEVYSSLNLQNITSVEQAHLVCDLLGADALLVPSVTVFDPYNPPKLGASLQLFYKPGAFERANDIDPRLLARQAALPPAQSLVRDGGFIQAVGMFDGTNGSVRDALLAYAAGRHDPVGPMGYREYLASMDRYCGFVYHTLLADLIDKAASAP